jgi:hypothetical protein
VIFPELSFKPVVAQFDQHHSSSDGGALLLKAADERLGLTQHLAECIDDRRDSNKITHEISELVRQRVFAMACGYADCNDTARLANDPIHKLLVDRDPIEGEALASQPTLSRFENSVGHKELYRMGEALAEGVIEHHRRRLRGKVRRITIDLDPTEDPTHGAQQLSFFNAHYDSWCYLPLLGFLSFDDEPEQYLCTAVLRPGNAPDKLAAVGILKRLLERVRRAFPMARIRVRLDGGFAAPEILDFLDEEPRVDYVVAMAKNAVLKRRAHRLMGRARNLSRESGKTEHVYGECRYAAGTWSHKRRVIIKAEVVRHPGREPKDNPRFVITNLTRTPRFIYERIYCARGDIENRIKELHLGLSIDRTSCPSFWANQFRVFLTAAAYILLQELRLHARKTPRARAQVWMLRDHLLKLSAYVVVSVRRIVLHLPVSFPDCDTWRRIAFSLGAKAG